MKSWQPYRSTVVRPILHMQGRSQGRVQRRWRLFPTSPTCHMSITRMFLYLLFLSLLSLPLFLCPAPLQAVFLNFFPSPAHLVAVCISVLFQFKVHFEYFPGLLCLRTPMVGVCLPCFIQHFFRFFRTHAGEPPSGDTAFFIFATSTHELFHQHILDSSLGVGL